MKQLQLNPNGFEKPKVRGLFSFLVKYPQTLIRATSVAFVANKRINAPKYANYYEKIKLHTNNCCIRSKPYNCKINKLT